MRRRTEGYWEVKWITRGRKTVRLLRSKRFQPAQYAAMTEFMAEKIERLGMSKVWLERYDRRGVRVYSSKPPRHRTPTEGTGGCTQALAASFETENFGSFAGLC